MKLGRVNVRKMLEEITYPEFKEWMIFESLETFSEERADVNAALLGMILANVNRDPKKKKDPYTISDFLLPFGDRVIQKPKPQVQTWQEMKMIAKMFSAPRKKPVRKRQVKE